MHIFQKKLTLQKYHGCFNQVNRNLSCSSWSLDTSCDHRYDLFAGMSHNYHNYNEIVLFSQCIVLSKPCIP